MEKLIDDFETIADGDMKSVFFNLNDLVDSFDRLRPGVANLDALSRLITETRKHMVNFRGDLQALKDQIDKSG